MEFFGVKLESRKPGWFQGIERLASGAGSESGDRGKDVLWPVRLCRCGSVASMCWSK
jgi:hypothetical protein